MNPKAIIMCGLPYSGKSTFSGQVSDWAITLACNKANSGTDGILNSIPDEISSDGYLQTIAQMKNITYTEAFDSYIKVADNRFWSDLEFGVIYGNNLIIDRTHLSEKSRNRTKERIRSLPGGMDYEIIYVLVECSEETRADRILGRTEKVISDNILNIARNSYDPPVYTMGQSVIMVNETNFSEKAKEVASWLVQ